MFRNRRSDDWEAALRPVIERVERLEREREQERIERADWAERLERLYHRVRMQMQRARGAETPQEAPEAAPEGLGTIQAIKRRLGRA
jgi:hypothetical protein